MTSGVSEKVIRAKRERERKDRVVDREVIEMLMRIVSGRRWVWLRLEGAMIFVADENLDAMRMAYLKGIRNEGLRLLAAVTRYCPQEYVRMTQENTGVELQSEGETEDEDEKD